MGGVRGQSGYALWANPTYSLRLFILRGAAPHDGMKVNVKVSPGDNLRNQPTEALAGLRRARRAESRANCPG